jgi:hypothetical protein
MAPSWISVVIFRQVLYQHSHVSERHERRYCRDNDPLGQGARPIRL